MDRENERFAQRLKNINAQAARFSAGELTNPKYLVAKFCFFAGKRLEADHRVNGQALPRPTSMPLGAVPRLAPTHRLV